LGSVQIVHLGIWGASVGGVGGAGETGRCATSATISGDTSSLVDAHHYGVEFAFELLLLGIDKIESFGVRLNELKSLSGGGLDGELVLGGEVSLQLLFVKSVLHLEAVVLKSVLGLDLLADGIILSAELVSVSDHLLDLFLGETTLIVGDSDLLGLSGGLIASGNVQDTVGIDIESDLDLGGATGCGGDTTEVELTKEMVVLGHLTLAFEDLDENTWLVVSVGGEGLLLLGGDACVTGNENSHDTAGSLDTLRKRGNIEEEEILDLLGTLTGEDGSLNGSTVGDSLVGVNGSVELLSVEEVGEHLLDLGDSGGTTDKDDLVDLRLGDVGVLEDLLDGGHALAEVGHAKLLELSAGHVNVEVLSLSEGLAVDFGLMGGRKNSLGLLALGSQATEGAGVALDVDAGLLLESSHAEVDKDVIEVLTTEMGVAVGGLDLEDTVLNSKEGHIESATTEIEDEHVLLTLASFVKTVGDGSGGGLVDDTLHVEASDGTSVLGGLALGVVEVSGDGDDSGGDGLAEVSLSDFLHLDEDHGGDLLSLVLLLLTLEVDNNHGLLVGAGLDLEGPEGNVVLDGLVGKFAADETFGVEDSVGGVTSGLVLGGVSDEALLLSEGNVRGGSVDTLVVGDDFDLVVLPHAYARVGRAEINSN